MSNTDKMFPAPAGCRYEDNDVTHFRLDPADSVIPPVNFKELAFCFKKLDTLLLVADETAAAHKLRCAAGMKKAELNGLYQVTQSLTTATAGAPALADLGTFTNNTLVLMVKKLAPHGQAVASFVFPLSWTRITQLACHRERRINARRLLRRSLWR